MKRFALTLAGLLALPALGAAQTGPTYTPEAHPQQLPRSRFAVTPFVATRLPFNTGDYYVTGGNGVDLLIEEERQGSPAVGLNLDVLVRGPFSLTAGVAYAGGSQDIVTFGFAGDSAPSGRVTIDAPSMYFAKAGITARLPDPVRDERRFHPSGFITVAPAMVFLNETPEQGSSRHFALNLGADATARIGQSPFAFQIGLEDYLTFWNTDEFEQREVNRFSNFPGFEETGVARVDYNYSTTNILMLRFGVSYRPLRRGTMSAGRYVAPLAPPPVASAQPTTPIRYCIVSGGRLSEIAAVYDPSRADTLVNGQPVAMTYPSDALPYASSQPWFIANAPVSLQGQRLVKYGLPRRLDPRDLQPAGAFEGVPIFAEAGTRGTPRVIYVPVRSGCEFQPYQNEDNVGSVRGE